MVSIISVPSTFKDAKWLLDCVEIYCDADPISCGRAFNGAIDFCVLLHEIQIYCDADPLVSDPHVARLSNR